MIASRVNEEYRYEHMVDCRIEVEIETTESLFTPELSTILLHCYKADREKTLAAVEFFLKEAYEDEKYFHNFR